MKKVEIWLRTLSPKERDLVLAQTLIAIEKILVALEKITEADKSQITKKEKKEIEHILTLGPKWLNYTMKHKKKT